METTDKPKNKGGRPEGSLNKLAREARLKAQNSGDGRLPHEILLDMARGKPVEMYVLDDKGHLASDDDGVLLKKLVVPDIECMRDSAKAAAPYFAPKISTVEVIQGISDNELDSIIERAAAEAGISIGHDGESTPPEGEAGQPGRAEPPAEVSSGRRRARLDTGD